MKYKNIGVLGAISVSALLCLPAFGDSPPEFDGAYVKTNNAKYIELNAVSPNYGKKLSGIYIAQNRQ